MANHKYELIMLIKRFEAAGDGTADPRVRVLGLEDRNGMFPNLAYGLHPIAVLRSHPRYTQLVSSPQTAAEAARVEAWCAERAVAEAACATPAERLQLPSPPPFACQLPEDVTQRSVLWHAVRYGRVTASAISELLGVYEPSTAENLLQHQVKTVGKRGLHRLDDAYERLYTVSLPRAPQIDSHEAGLRACNMQRGTDGEPTALLTYLASDTRLRITEAGVAHLKELPCALAEAVDMAHLPGITVSPDAYLVSVSVRERNWVGRCKGGKGEGNGVVG